MDNVNEIGLIVWIEEKYFNYLNCFDYVDVFIYFNVVKNILLKYWVLFEKYKGELEWFMLVVIVY